MDIETFRNYCLSLPRVTEKMPWTDDKQEYNRGLLVFSVVDKWFCFVHVDEFEFCCVKLTPEFGEEMRNEYEGIRPGWHMNKKHWNSIYFNSDVSDEKIFELLKTAHATVAAKLPKAVRTEIGF